MLSVKVLPAFTAWRDDLTDASIRGGAAARIKRLERGLPSEVEPVGDGVSELRIHVGAGWRVYFTRRGGALVVLLPSGSKRTQKCDIKRAKALAAMLDRQRKQRSARESRLTNCRHLMRPLPGQR